MTRTIPLLLSGVMMFGAASAFADGPKPEDAIKYRRGVMAAQGWNFKDMGAVVKGEAPYNKEAFAQRAANLAALSKMGLEGFTIAGSDKGETKAKPEAFAEMDKFKGGMNKLETETAKLAQVAAGGDLGAIKAQFGEVGKLCKGCHDNFRVK